jgi:hypothetical protein
LEVVRGTGGPGFDGLVLAAVPRTRDREIAVTPARNRAAFTSASFSGRMIVVTSFISRPLLSPAE